MDVIAASRCRLGTFLNFERLKSHDYPSHPKNSSTKTQVYIGFVQSMIRGGGKNNDPCVRFKNVLRPFLLDGVFNVLHVGENKFPVVALESLHKLQVAADLKTLDRFLLRIKQIKDSEERATSHPPTLAIFFVVCTKLRPHACRLCVLFVCVLRVI